MKNTLYAVVAACLAMLATSGIVALATAAPAVPTADVSQPQDADFEAWISAQIDAQYRAVQQRN